jgi:phospholipid transport system transporter-binding protein
MQLPATATLAEACSLLQALGDDTDRIDASALTVFDTSVLALVLEARRRAQHRGKALVVQGAPPKLRQLAQLYGVDELLSFELAP